MCNCSCLEEPGRGYRGSQCPPPQFKPPVGCSGQCFRIGKGQETSLIARGLGVILFLLELPLGLGRFKISERASLCELRAKVCQVSHRKHPWSHDLGMIQATTFTRRFLFPISMNEPIVRPPTPVSTPYIRDCSYSRNQTKSGCSLAHRTEVLENCSVYK